MLPTERPAPAVTRPEAVRVATEEEPVTERPAPAVTRPEAVRAATEVVPALTELATTVMKKQGNAQQWSWLRQ